MRTTRIPLSLRYLFFLAATVLAAITLASPAVAFGTFTLKSNAVDEVDGRWKFDVEVDYGSKPHLGHVPFDFVFVQKVYYEYSIIDSDKEPVVRPKPMHNQTPQREQMDITFSDARGELWQRTKFSFSLRRDREFAAGEYTLTVRRTSDGAILGREMRITLKGQNELIDRRAIVFAGESRKKPEANSAAASGEGSKPAQASAATDDGDSAAASSRREDDLDGDEPNGPPAVDRKAKGAGCGCRTVSGDRSGSLAPLLGVLLVGVGVRSRRRLRN